MKSSASVARRLWGEVAFAVLALAGALWATDGLARAGGWLAGASGLASALAFVLIPLGVLRRAGPELPPMPDPLGIDRAPIVRGVAAGLLVSMLVLPLFAVGLDVLQTQFLHNRRHGASSWRSAGVDFQGRTFAGANHVVVVDDRGGLAIENRLNAPILVRPACQGSVECAPRTVGPGGRVLLRPLAAAGFAVTDPAGAALDAGVIIAGGSAQPLESPLELPPSLAWLLPFLLTQLLVVALPEEIFFRGYVLGRLSQLWPPSRRLLGVPFGAAHVVSSVLFALIHLVTTPAPARLLVFFPALLFAWLAERTRGTFAPAVHHALANTVQALLLMLYASS